MLKPTICRLNFRKGSWKICVVIWIVSVAGLKLLSGCAKKVVPMEDRIIDPITIGCSCKELKDLTHFLLVGDKEYFRLIGLLKKCESQGLIESLEAPK